MNYTGEQLEKFMSSVNDMNLQRIKDKNESDERLAKLESEVARLKMLGPME